MQTEAIVTVGSFLLLLFLGLFFTFAGWQDGFGSAGKHARAYLTLARLSAARSMASGTAALKRIHRRSSMKVTHEAVALSDHWIIRSVVVRWGILGVF
jgi:hypothetical protein